MSTSLFSVLGQPGRSFEWLTAPDALMSSTALSSGELGVLGPILSTVESGPDLTSTDSGTSGLLGPVIANANDAVLDVHASLEDTGHQITPLNGPIHALTNLGETIGLGKIGEPDHLLTDLIHLPQSILDGGGLASAAPALTDIGSVLGAADGLVGSLTGAVAGSNPLAADGLLAPVSDVVNGTASGLHQALDGIGQSVSPLGDALHGVNGLTDSLGLGGQLGTPGNLLTDVVALPGNLLGGHGIDALSPVVGDLGTVLGSATGLLQDVLHVPTSLVGDLAGNGGILSPVTSLLGGLTSDGGVLSPVTAILGGVTGDGGGLTGNLLGSDGLLLPVANIANGPIDAIHANLENVGHDMPLLNDPLHQVINLGTTVGLGALGEGNNLLTDVADLPGSILSGDVAGGLDHVVGDLGNVVGAATGVVGSVPGVLGGLASGGDGSVGGLLSPATSILGDLTGGDQGSPVDGILAPVTSLLGGVTGGGDGSAGGGLLSPVTAILGGVTGDGSSGGLLSPVTSILDGVTGGDHGSTGGILSPVTSILDGVTGGGDGSSGGGLLAPVTGLLSGVTGGGSSDGGLLSPVTSLLGGLGGGSADGTHPLIDISAGPTTSAPVANVSVLTPPSDASHAIQLGAIGVGADQPSLINASLLNGDSLPLPTTGGGGADSLVGHALDLVHNATSGSTSADTTQHTGLDLGLAAIDLGGHTDLHHTDPTPHSSTGGLHLLGL
ncbi:hypothetical protein [Methylobacterium brachythecii]|uniref:Bacterial collagen-like protein middle domain-containing protein n=1 Tax=Methylobacterium brachythecii TaxID=1176177 RepID=A0A7W6F7Q3_9HYPH|nr:hypothetical protein [Methylobacterium brachythecii]MBB3903604.1 hypothetical protein [Methylobacterium brachythecii]GLS46916.1 hypothetical protein GCM10007884_49150 [Methylobacterium brachythecii]